MGLVDKKISHMIFVSLFVHRVKLSIFAGEDRAPLPEQPVGSVFFSCSSNANRLMPNARCL